MIDDNHLPGRGAGAPDPRHRQGRVDSHRAARTRFPAVRRHGGRSEGRAPPLELSPGLGPQDWAVSAPLRLRILQTLADEGPIELWRLLEMIRSDRDPLMGVLSLAAPISSTRSDVAPLGAHDHRKVSLMKKSKRPSPQITYRMGLKRLVNHHCLPGSVLIDRELGRSRDCMPGDQDQIEGNFHGQAMCVIVLVPTPAWVTPVSVYFRSVFGDRWVQQTRDASCVTSAGSSAVSRAQSAGQSVVGISADVSLLAATLVGAADATISLTPPNGAVLKTSISRFTKRPTAAVEDSVAVDLGLDDILAAFRPGTGPQRIVQRLAAAAAAGGTSRSQSGVLAVLVVTIELLPAGSGALRQTSRACASRTKPTCPTCRTTGSSPCKRPIC
jgi:hypothetical protein